MSATVLGAKEMSQVFKTERRWSLGLSATPEREDDVDADYDKSLLGKELGPIIYEFNLADAVKEGLVPKFVINHFGLPMTPQERSRYDALSRSITDAMSQLRAQRDTDGDFFTWARGVAARNKGELGSAIAMRFVSDTSKRRELLNLPGVATPGRRIAPPAANLCRQQGRPRNPVVSLCDQRGRGSLPPAPPGLDAIMEHSELPARTARVDSNFFRRSAAKIIVSARSLIEAIC